MKRYCLAMALISSMTGFSQTDAASASRDFAPAKRYVMAPTQAAAEDEASVQMNFINQNWSPGTVTLKSGRSLNLALIFDVFGNKLYFNQNNVIMEFAEPIAAFNIALIAKGDTNKILYRNDYPPIHRNTAETFYEVLAGGKVQLLKCKAKTIYLHREENIPEEQRTYHKEMFYAYLPDGKIIPIKKDKADLLKQLPEQAAAISSILDKKKLKIKNEDSLRELFVYLNDHEE